MPGSVAALVALFAAAVAGAGQPIEFCSDRPGLTTGICLAAPGTFQLETGFAEWSRTDGESELALASSVLRFGIDRRTDLHLAFTPYLRVEDDDGSHSGAGDVVIAVKHVVTAPEAAVGLGIMPFVKLPTARRPIGNGEWEGGLLAAIEVVLATPWSLTFTPEIGWNADGDGHGHHPRLSLAATVGADLDERWSASLDALIARERDSGQTVREFLLSGSLAYRLAQTVQLDAQADFGLTSDSPDMALTTGIAFRF